MRALREIRVDRLRIPLTQPYRLSFGAVEHYDSIVVEVIHDDGRHGAGEATVLTGYTDETIDECWVVARRLAAQLADSDDAAALAELQRTRERFPFTATAFATALEMAAGTARLAVNELTPVPILGLLHATEASAIAAEVDALLAAGYCTIKVKIGFDAERDAQRVRMVQKIVSGRTAIRLDANQGYDAAQGVAFARALDPADIELFEQPCAAGDWDAHLEVARVSPVPLMLDESIYGVADIERAAALKAAAFIKVKLMKFATLERLAQAIGRIRELGMTPVLGNGVATDLGCWMEACVAARLIDNAGEMNGFLKTRASLLVPTLEFRDGRVWLRPDYAPCLDPEALARYRVDSISCRSRAAAAAADAPP
jgi:L-alanine-DL-glutamate epimerase-like enolase superfamily enzyme